MRRVTIGSVLIAGVGLAAWLLVTQGPRGGPLAPPPGDSTIGFTEVQPNRAFTFGGIFLHNRGTESAVLDGVHLRDSTEGLRIVDRYVVLPGESLQVAARNVFPPPEVRLHPLEGFVLAPGERAQVLLGLVVESRGSYSAKEVVLVYHSEGQGYEAVFRDGVMVDI